MQNNSVILFLRNQFSQLCTDVVTKAIAILVNNLYIVTMMAVRSAERFLQSVREGQGFYRVINQVPAIAIH